MGNDVKAEAKIEEITEQRFRLIVREELIIMFGIAGQAIMGKLDEIAKLHASANNKTHSP